MRRLVRQFDLDITGIHGTGPDGRIRVGDVMGLLGGRTDSGNRDAPARAVDPVNDDDRSGADDVALEPPAGSAQRANTVEEAAHAGVPTTTVFDCDLSRVLSHRKKLRRDSVELLTTSYFLTALAAALDSAPEITAGHAPRFGLSLSTVDGAVRSALVDVATVEWDAALDKRVRAVDAALRATLDADLAAANLLVHHYGESGGLLASPTPIGAGHTASVGIGRVRREIVVRTVDGVESPRVAARCYVSLSFFAEDVPLHHANKCLAEAVRLLEQWPD
ncbi:MAG TPA: E3 binding domain-containing protein [Gammaproteobacteria bacterium]|nr:E3 binding domain-containing protein [Gammaproteobacteria bacterium]